VSEAELARLLREHADAHSVPGAAIGILQDGVTTAAAHGVADTSTGDRVTPETRFGLGSLTKSMVGTSLARLAEAGRLSLDDPVTEHVPELRATAWARRASVRDLLANRSGFPLRADLEFDFSSDDGEDALSRLASRVASAEPTTGMWSYTNAGWSLLGRVMETVTGTTWEDAMRIALLAPAAMEQTTFSTQAPREPRAFGHALGAGGLVPVERLTAPAYAPAGTSTLSTVEDMLRFAALQLDDPSLAFLRTTQAEIRIDAWFDAWCLGWARFDWEGGPVWGWDGLLPGERSVLRLLPEQRAAIVLFTNSDAGRAVYRSLFADVMPRLFGITPRAPRLEPVAGAAGDLARFAGVYAWPDRRFEVAAKGDVLLIDDGHGATEAAPLDDRTFLVDASDLDTPSMTFGDFDETGRPGVLYEMIWGLPRQ
jgi:CubicO group peptidase (beta-lactamase class C family)